MLTRKQHELLMFIHERIKESGVSPSFDEMKDALDLASKSGIHRLITALEERGFLRRLPHRARAPKQGRGGCRAQVVRNCSQRLDRCDHIVCIAAVIVDAGYSEVAAGNEIAASAAVADKADSAEPADTDPLTDAPSGNLGARLFNTAGDLVPWHGWVMNSGEATRCNKFIAMTDAASLYLKADFTRTGLGHRPLNQLEGCVRFVNLHNTHEASPTL
jgi:hypothetical protein